MLFRVDPGWLFIVAGLALCVAGVLIPAQRDLFELQQQLVQLRQQEQAGNERLRRTAQFLRELDEGDVALTRRLAALHLNVVPAGDVPVVLASQGSANATDWIEARVAPADVAQGSEQLSVREAWPDSTLSQLATGPKRLWLLGGGVLAVFVGLMLGPEGRRKTASVPRRTETNDRPLLFEDKEMTMPIAIALAEASDSVTLEAIEAIPEGDELLCEIFTASEFAVDAGEGELREMFCADAACGAD